MTVSIHLSAKDLYIEFKKKNLKFNSKKQLKKKRRVCVCNETLHKEWPISHDKMFNLIRQIKITIKFHYTSQTANM